MISLERAAKKFLIISCPKHTESVRKAIKLYSTDKKRYDKVDFLAL